MAYRIPKSQIPAPAAGVTGMIAARSRKRRETQRALSEIGARANVAPRNDLAPELRFETRPTDSLRPASQQIRRRDAKQSAKLQASIDRFGLCRPILIDAEGTIVEGHGLWEAANPDISNHDSASDRLIGLKLFCENDLPRFGEAARCRRSVAQNRVGLHLSKDAR